MRGYDRDEVDEYDEYEDEGEEQYGEGEEEEGEEEEYEEEERKPTEEELEYLNLRQRLKERYRKNLKKENGVARGSSQDKNNKLPYDNYGSFFGPSQPVISQRVIQESKSLLETQHLNAMLSNAHRKNEKTSASHNTGSRNGVNVRPPKVNELQKKVERIKVSRDYSFLSDDADPPAPAPKRAPPTRNVSVPNSEARSAKVPPKSKPPLGNSSRHVHGAREERSQVSSNGQMHSSRDERRPISSNGQMHSARDERKLVSSNGKMHSKPGYKSTSVNKPNLSSVDSRKQHSSSNGTGPGRPAGLKAPPFKMPVASMEKKASALGAKNQLPTSKIPPTSKILPSVQKKQVEQRRGLDEHNRGKPTPKQLVAPSKPQMNKPLKQISSHAATQDQRPKKKPLRRFSDDEGDDDAMAFSMLRSMLGPRKYADYDDDDDSDMEAGFDDIMREEKRSARIARKEDEEQLRLIEEEERQERMRKLAKKRKLSQQH